LSVQVMKGLEDIIIDTSGISLIDGLAGRLIYRGHDIRELIDLSFEEVAFLLQSGELPLRKQLKIDCVGPLDNKVTPITKREAP